jgi:hypothetical protein
MCLLNYAPQMRAKQRDRERTDKELEAEYG